MANNKVKHYRTDVAGRKPEAKNMLDGEIAINLADKKIFTKFGDAVINIGNGADAVVEGGQTFTGKIKASDIESDLNLTLKNLNKSDIVFADEHGKAKARISSPAQTDAKGELRVTVAKGKATGESSDFVLNGNGQLSLPAAPDAPESATRKDYVDSEIAKVQTGSSADLTKLEQKVDANDAAINTRVDNLNSKVDQNDTAINTKVDANKADADEKIKAVNDRLTVDNQTLKDMIDTKVNRSGDTMTGDLTVPKLNATDVKTTKMLVSTNPVEANYLGDNSIAMGDGDTGLKWRQDGWLNFYSNNVVTASISDSENFFNRKTHFRFRSDDGDSNLMAHDGLALIQIDTTTDGNGIGDATTYFGLANSGKYYHYLRGSGRTYIDTKEGLDVAGPASFYQTIYNNKGAGSYDSESMTVSSTDTNYLRKFRSTNGASIWHELSLTADHPIDVLKDSLSYLHGNGPEQWISALKTDGTLNLRKGIVVYGESNAIQMNIPSANQASYIAGNMDGRGNAWILGKTSENLDIVWSQNMRNDFSMASSVSLKSDGSVDVQAGTNRIARFEHNRIEIDGSRWAATNGHAWADQWKQTPPVMINFGDQVGASDYYPGYSLRSVSAGKGWPTRVELGMIRDNATDNGKAVIRVASVEEEGRKDIAANYIFDVYGGFFTNMVNAQRIETNQITNFAVGNTVNSLGGNSIAFGDNDTGIRQRTDGHLEVITDSLLLATFSPSGLATDRQIAINTPNDSRGIYVGNARAGGSNAMIAGKVEGWADWGAWRDRPAGMIVEAPASSKCINIWKHVHWGAGWGAAMDVYNPENAGPEAQLHVGGANYHFSGNGIASATQWSSTSDKRLKSNFEEIENAVDKVEKLTGYVYDKKSDLVETKYSFEVREAGIIAQDLKEVLPEAVSSFGEDEILGVNSAAVNALLINAIKELSARVKELEAK